MDLFLFNSLTRKKEKFVPLDSARGKPVGLYTCGPTVYDYATIGNFRTYTSADILVRALKYSGYKVKYIMNITDVGHLTGDNLGDADIGEDRLEKAAKKERKTAWDIAKFYTKAFFVDFEKLNLEKPEKFVKATDHINEQVDLVKRLEGKGLTYRTSDGIYFDTIAFEEKTGKKYSELSTLDRIKEGARVEANPEKRNPRDFALWKFSPKGVKRDMEWESPWAPPGARGKVMGFPGWHVECSAMSMKYLGETFDIHVGGEDLRSTHHPNEIAQSEGATGKKFVNYWIHGAFLKVDGGRMGKSLGNAYRIYDLEKRGYDALDLRYFYLSGKYNEPLNFTWESLKASQVALAKLRSLITVHRSQSTRTTISEYRNRFLQAINDDLNTPQALAVLWEMLKSSIPSSDKYDLALSFDEVLGLELSKSPKKVEIPEEIKKLIAKRSILRKEGKFEEADEIRKQIERKGFNTQDEKISR